MDDFDHIVERTFPDNASLSCTSGAESHRGRPKFPSVKSIEGARLSAVVGWTGPQDPVEDEREQI